MEFGVVFKTRKGEPLVEKLGTPGLDILDIVISENPEIANLKIENIRINTSCPINGDQKYIEVPVVTARKSGHFAGKTQISVNVSAGFMSQFVTFDTRIGYHEYNNRNWIVRCVMQGGPFKKNVPVSSSSDYKFDKEALLAHWAAKGYPMNLS